MTERESAVGVEVLATELPHGRRLVVRPATGDDVDGLARLYGGLDVEDSYRRFFSVFRPDAAFIERMATAGERGGDELLAVVEEADGTTAVVAEAGYCLLPNGDGELSMAVARRWRGWLSAYLLDALLRRATARGVRNLRADVLATNGPMLALLCARGWARVHEEEWSVIRLLIGTSGTTPSWPEGHDRPRMLVEIPGGRWQAGSAARSAGFDVIGCPGPSSCPARCPALRGEVCPLVAGADVVVVHARDDDAWHALAAAHGSVHDGVPIVVAPAEPDEAFFESLPRGAVAAPR